MFSRKLHSAVLLVVILAAVTATSAHAKGYSTRTLSDAKLGTTKSELQAQMRYSTSVLRSLTRPKVRWKLAPRHATCWSHVPWAKTCNQARTKLLAHRWLYKMASDRYARLYQPRPVEPSGSAQDIICAVFGSACGEAVSVALCVSHLSTGAANGQYLGIFQMGENERSHYATIGYSTVYEQVVAAHNYYLVAGWGPWQCA